MEKKNNKDKKRTFIIIGCVALILILLIVILLSISHHGKTDKGKVEEKERYKGVYIDPNTVVAGSVHPISEEHCTAGNIICIHDINIVYDGNKGVINYGIDNNTNRQINGAIRLTLGDRYFILTYDLAPFAETTGYFGYDGYDFDLSDLGTFEVEDAQASDISNIYDNFTEEDKESIAVNP
ncbi:MAG: hypothetical protein J6X28_03600 [Bacilli bacterium]|nr:hypothetical protein [Bacilli bacterium]